jgi:Holliday junction resolvasome RuvABC endonuclease subunit
MVLAVNPGTRYLGLAVFYGQYLKDWRTKALKGPWSKEKLTNTLAIISSWIAQYEPDCLVIKKLHPARSSESLDVLAGKMEELGLKDGLPVRRYSIKELEAFLCHDAPKNKRNLAEAVAANFPELYLELMTERNRKNPYHMRMFEAVALGAMCISELDNH